MTNQYLTPTTSVSDDALGKLLAQIRACTLCRDQPLGAPLPHPPRPVLHVSATVRLLIASQAPGNRVNQSGISFTDSAGDRLRHWLGLDVETFYDDRRIAIVAMGFCFPGNDAKGGDLPPRRECRLTWHDRLFAQLPHIELTLAIGRYAQAYHFARAGLTYDAKMPLEDIIRRSFDTQNPRLLALPHPSWRNTGWLRKHPWFEAEVLPRLRQRIGELIGSNQSMKTGV